MSVISDAIALSDTIAISVTAVSVLCHHIVCLSKIFPCIFFFEDSVGGDVNQRKSEMRIRLRKRETG